MVPRAVFGLRFNGKAARTARAGRGFREERRETGARLGCFGGRKIGKFYGFGENADSLLHFKLLYCIHPSRLPRGAQTMTVMNRSAEYRYFSFTYFMGKAYFGLAESKRV